LGLGLKDVKGDQRSRIIHEIQLDNIIEYDRDAKEAKSIHKTAKLIEYVGMIPVGISAILAIIACICDCVLLSQTSQSRGVTHTVSLGRSKDVHTKSARNNKKYSPYSAG